MTNPALHDPVPPRSTFVTVIAWLFIVLSGFATLISILQNAMMAMMPFDDHLDRALRDSTFSSAIPPASQFLVSHFRTLLVVTLGACVVTLVASIGLLRRQNWARITFIVLLALSIAYMVASLFFQSAMMPDLATYLRTRRCKRHEMSLPR